jgi:hypothetical protein
MGSFYPDLSNYDWGNGAIPNLLTVGFLHNQFPYRKGRVPEPFVDKLENILIADDRLIIMRGYFTCGICTRSQIQVTIKETSKLISHLLLLIPFGENGSFISPGTIYHHIKEHDYKPPDEYIEAVMAYDLAKPCDPDEILLKLAQAKRRRNEGGKQ